MTPAHTRAVHPRTNPSGSDAASSSSLRRYGQVVESWTTRWRSRWLRVTAGLLVVWVAAACSGDDEPAGPAASAGGAALYEQSCASCHGSDLRGTDRGPSHLSQVYAPDHHPDESFRSAITQGASAHHWAFGDMAPIDGLTDDEIDQIIAFVREQQEAQGFEPYPPR